MKLLKIFCAVLFVSLLSQSLYTETDIEKGTLLMVKNNLQPRFQKVQVDIVLEIYSSDGKLNFVKKMIVAQYIENQGKMNQIEHSISYFKEPADDRGNAYLAHDYKYKEDVKIAYLKGIRKAKKITGATRKGSFFGSDFANDDMGYPDLSEFNCKFLRMEKCYFKGKEFNCHVIEAIPKSKKLVSDIGYGRKVTYLLQVNNKSFLTIKLEYFDENLKKLKVLTLKSFITKKNIYGQTVFYTTGLEMRNVQKGTWTNLKMKNVRIENQAKFKTNIFSEQHLTKRWW
jgi:hypothetical protein